MKTGKFGVQTGLAANAGTVTDVSTTGAVQAIPRVNVRRLMPCVSVGLSSSCACFVVLKLMIPHVVHVAGAHGAARQDPPRVPQRG